MRAVCESRMSSGVVPGYERDLGYKERFWAFVQAAREKRDGHEVLEIGKTLVEDPTDIGVFTLGMEKVMAGHIDELRNALRVGFWAPQEKEALEQLVTAVASNNHATAQHIGASLFLDEQGDFQEGKADLAFAMIYDVLSRIQATSESHPSRKERDYEQNFETFIKNAEDSNDLGAMEIGRGLVAHPSFVTDVCIYLARQSLPYSAYAEDYIGRPRKQGEYDLRPFFRAIENGDDRACALGISLRNRNAEYFLNGLISMIALSTMESIADDNDPQKNTTLKKIRRGVFLKVGGILVAVSAALTTIVAINQKTSN